MSKQQAVFDRKQLAGCSEFREQVDLINALLDPNKSYTKEETRRILRNYLKGTVK